MAREDTTDDDGAATDSDPSAGRSDGLRARFDRWAAARPTLGATLLGLGSAVLAWRVLAQLSAVPLGRITPVGFAGGIAPFVGVVLGLFVLARPEKARLAGGTGFGLIAFTFAGILLSGVPLAHPELAFTGFVIGGIGAVICLAWDRTSTVRVERGPVFRAGRAALVCGLVLALAFTAAPAVSGDTFPAQSDTLDGFVVSQSSLDSGMYSYQTDRARWRGLSRHHRRQHESGEHRPGRSPATRQHERRGRGDQRLPDLREPLHGPAWWPERLLRADGLTGRRVE
jgi:hypothetical protein